MRSLLLLFCCCCCVCAVTICHSTIYNNYSLECLSSFVAAVCGHCFSCQFISHCCAVCLPAPHKRHTHTLHSFSVSQSCFYQYEIGFGDPGFFNVWPCLHISTHMTIVQVNLIRCTHRTDEYVK